MANLERLKSEIDKSGYKYGFIAEQLGLSRSGLWKKMQGDSQFTVNEVVVFRKLLKLDTKQIDDIFLI